MNILILLVGLLLPTIFGWLLLIMLEGHHPVLTRTERGVWAVLIGPMLFVFLVFLGHILFGLPFTLAGFLAPLLAGITLLLILNRWRGLPLLGSTRAMYALPASHAPKWVWWGVALLILWTLVKIGAGGYDLGNTPTYQDDAFNNWNMRAKVYYETKALTLEFETQNDAMQTATGVNSYPPGVPLLKVWLTVLRGSWQEPLVNGLHLLWYIGLLAAFGLTLRREQGVLRALIGFYALASLPLLLVQGMNPYADIAVAAYLFLAMSALLGMMRSSSRESIRTWSILLGLATAALLFIKNEALLLYVPVLLLLCLYAFLMHRRASRLSAKEMHRIIITLLILIGAVAIPWTLFKWMHGLTFGNAKSIGESAFSFHPVVLQAIWYMLAKEASFLILPFVFLASLGARWHSALRSPIRELILFVVVTVCIQFSLFIFVDALVNEATQQTGLARGLVHIAPVALLCVFLLWPPKVGHTATNHQIH